MEAQEAATFYREVQALGVDLWIDGGWGVDALLGRQTRPHADLDIVLEAKDCDAVVQILLEKGYKDVPRDDRRPCNFVLGNDQGKEIDFHIVVFDAEGNGLYGPPGDLEGLYPADAFQGRGQIGGVAVKCMSPEYQLENHCGYAIRAKDVHDVMALAKAFRLPLPEAYRRESDI